MIYILGPLNETDLYEGAVTWKPCINQLDMMVVCVLLLRFQQIISSIMSPRSFRCEIVPVHSFTELSLHITAFVNPHLTWLFSENCPENCSLM